MFTTAKYKGFLKRKTVWFAKSLNFINALGLYEYLYCQETDNCWGFVKQDNYTKFIELTKSSDEILNQFNKTTKYQIRRAIRQGAEFEIESDTNVFTNFYNGIAESNNLSHVKSKDLASFKKNLFISKAIHENRCFVMHANIFDPKTKRVQLYKSASQFRMYSDNRERSLSGRLNRYLHFMDMLYAKDMNMLKYDFGGYALNTQDVVLKNINIFKDAFKARLQKECNYTAYPLWILLKIKRLMNI